MQFSLKNIYFFIAYDFTIDINATEKDKHQFKIKNIRKNVKEKLHLWTLGNGLQFRSDGSESNLQ